MNSVNSTTNRPLWRAIFCLACVLAVSVAQAGPIKHIVFFGDSLSDNGNFFRQFNLPKAPYFQGRFSNGPTWAEDIAKVYHDNYLVDTQICAEGNSKVLPQWLQEKKLGLRTQVTNYLAASIRYNRPYTLYVFWAGANDYLNGKPNEDEATTNVTNEIMSLVNLLMDNGGRYFLFMNLPDLSMTPKVVNEEGGRLIANTKKLSDLHNKKLAAKIAELVKNHPDNKYVLVDMHQFYMNLMTHTDSFNQSMGVHLKNTNQPCYLGWVFGASSGSTSNTASPTIAMTVAYAKDNPIQSAVDVQNTVLLVTHSPMVYDPALLTTDVIPPPCTDTDDYVFWDKVHPTALIHQLLAKIAIDGLLAANLTG